MVTKKTFTIIRLFLISFISMLFMTCDPGLGKAVDTQPPKVVVEFPPTKSVLKGGFTVKGVASDEVKVASCTVTFTNMNNSALKKTYTAEIGSDRFTVNINPVEDGLKDGDYLVTVSASDAYRNTSAEVVYTIDNTAPTVLITSPNIYQSENWPTMYKIFTVKGEVYDATTISEVTVYIVDENGVILDELVADGTNTFLAHFSEPKIENGKTCFYYAVAKDAGGNTNTSYYHKADIFELISSQKSTTFPAINSIGKVDQKEDSSFNGNINFELLSKKRKSIKISNETKGSYPGFDYYENDTAKIKWMNISDEEQATIAIGVPVIGTIMPPADDSAITTVKVWLSKLEGSVWGDYKELETGWINKDENGQIIGEEKQVKLTNVGGSVNFQIDSHDVGSLEDWVSATYRVKVEFETNSGTINLPIECDFVVASGAPKLSEGAFAPDGLLSYYRGYLTAKDKGNARLAGFSKTSDEASSLPLKYDCTKIGNDIDVTVNNEDGSYEIPIEIDAENHKKDGEYTYTLTSTAGDLYTVISRVVVIDTTAPTIIFNNLEDNKVLESKVYTVKGNIEDANGISQIDYKLYKADTQILLDGTIANTTEWINISQKFSSFEFSLSNLEKDKDYTLILRATDVAGNEKEETKTFILDKDAPEITETVSPLIMYDNDNDPNTPEEETVNGTISISVKASDDGNLQAVYYTDNPSLADDADWSGQKLLPSTGKIELDTTLYTDGTNLPLKIKAIDGAGNYTIKVVNPVVNQESDRPMIVPSNFGELDNIELAGMTVNGGVNVYSKTNPNMIFTLSDDDLVKEYYVKINNGDYTKVTDVNLSQKIMSYSIKDLDYGRHTLSFKAVDQNYKNDVETPYSFIEKDFFVAIDDGQPQLTLDNANNQFVAEKFVISGKVIDENGIEGIHLQSKESSAIYTTLNLGNGLKDDGTFSYEFTVPPQKEPIVITAVDKIGNTSSVDFTYLVDTVSPIVTVTTRDLAVSNESPLTRIEGIAYDKDDGISDVSGIDQVRVKIGSSITGVDDEDSVLASGSIDNSGRLTWDAILNFSGLSTGTHYIYAVAFDNAGNKSEEDIVSVSIDADNPQITHNYGVNGDIGVKTETFTIEGYATDSSGIKSISAKIQGQSNNLEGGIDNETGYWSFDVPATTDGSLIIVINAIDNCNKRSEDVTLRVKLDSKPPVVEFTNIEENGSTKQTGSSPYVAVLYSDETSGVQTFEYKFYYKPNGQNEFTEYVHENAKGTVDCSGYTSNNFKINMAGRTSVSGKGPFIDQLSETDGVWKLWYSVTDCANHVVEDYSPEFIVDRHAPTPTVNNVNDLIKQGDPLTVSGSVVDDYGGTVDSVTVAVVHNLYQSEDLDKFKKTFTIDNGLEWNSSKYVYDWTVTWDEDNSPFKYSDDYEIIITAYDTAENQYEIKKIVSCDNTAPKINFTKPYSYSVDSYGKITSPSSVNSPIGNTVVSANIDEFKMSEIYYQIGGSVEISSEGTIENSDYKIKEISITDGAIQDVDEEGVDDNPRTELIGIWKKLGDANNGFSADVDTLRFFTEGKTKELLDDDNSNDDSIIQTLEIHLVAIDVAGNINYAAMPIKVDTDTDKPEVLILSPKTILQDSVLVANVGGTTTLSGTVSDDNCVHSVWVNIEVDGGNYVDNILKHNSEDITFKVDYSNSDYGVTEPQSITVDEANKTFTLPESDSDYFASKNKWYKVNLGAEDKTSTTWNLMLNKFSEFDVSVNLKDYFVSRNNETLEETSLTIKVVALDIKGDDTNLTKTKLSDIKEFTLKIDSGSPSIIFNNIDKIPVEGSFIGGNIDYDLTFTDDGQITYWSVIAKGSKGEYEIASGTPNVNSYDEIVTIDTALINEQCGNVITLKFYAEDNSKDASGEVENNKTSEETFKYTIDNSAPVASVAETIESINYLIATESVVGDSTGEHRETEERGNHLRIKSKSALLSGKISDEINGSGIDYVMLYFTKTEDGSKYIYNVGKAEDNKTGISNVITLKDKDGLEESIYFPLESLTNVTRNNNSSSSTDYIIIDKAEGLLDNGSNGDGDGYDENLKANGEWMVSIDSTNMKDGVYEITYIVVDIAGNARFYKDSMFVQNYAPIISSVILATDINADGECITDELDEDGEAEKFDSSTDISETNFIVRNNLLKIKVNVTGGTKPLKYFLKYKNSSNNQVTTDASSDGYSTGTFTITDFPADGNVVYTVWVEDSVEESLSLSSGTTEIGLVLDNQDNVKPLNQFYELNTITEDSKISNKERGSLYTNSNGIVQGHIEPRGNSKFDNDEDDDPDVSGTIILRGESYDDQRISSIKLTLNGTDYIIASWESNTLVAQNGATIKGELGLSGHYVEWSYPWDTNSIASRNVNISVTTEDASSNMNDSNEYSSSDNTPRTEENKFTKLNWGYNKMTVDVVPYITSIKRNIGYTTKRTRSGSYPLLCEESSNVIEGFNLIAGTVELKITSDSEGSTSIVQMSNVVKSGADINFDVPTSAKDGYLHLTVNTVPALNNINDNSLDSNKEVKDTNSKYWTDDRFIRVWKDTDRFGNDAVGTTGVELAKNPAYPAMSMSADGTLYASYTNYSMHNVYYTTIDGNSTAVFNGYDSPEETTIFVTGSGNDAKVNVAYMANYQSGGNYANWTHHRDDAGGLYLYDKHLQTMNSTETNNDSIYDFNVSGFRGYCMTRFELLYHDKQFQQFKNFRLARKDTATNGRIHIAYYDIDTMSIHYSNVSIFKSDTYSTYVGREHFEASWVNIDGDFDDHDYESIHNTTYVRNDGSENLRISDETQNIVLENSFSDGLVRTSATGEYVGIDLTNDNYYPVLAYYDSVNQVLKLARANVENPKKSDSNWTVQRVITNSADANYITTNGNYVDLQIDEDGYVHIVFVNGRGELVYIKSENNPNDGNTAYIFGESTVIAENSPMNVDLTVRGTTPYIGYLSSLGSFDGLNVAFIDKSIDLNSNGIEDDWETMSSPLVHAVSNNRATVEVHPTPTASEWESAHAYYSGGYYRVAKYIGSGNGH